MPTHGDAARSPDSHRNPAAGEQPHRHRGMAESFGTDAARYDRARPPYSDELIDRIVAGRRELTVLDVGCGTGIVARQLRSRGASVLGVEPDRRMAEFARTTGVQVDVSTFERWDARGRTFDVVVAGQSWHWVDPAAGANRAADLLDPGGRIVLFGHVFAPPEHVALATAAAVRRLAPHVPPPATNAGAAHDGYQAMYRGFAEAIGATGRFGAVEHWRFDWRRQYTRDQWLDLLPTTGSLTTLEPEVLAEILQDTAAAIDAGGGIFDMDYATIGVAATKHPVAAHH